MSVFLEELIASSPGLSPGGLDPAAYRLGHRIYHKKGGGSGAPDPDVNVRNAGMDLGKLGDEWLQFAKDQFAIANERQQGIDGIGGKLSDALLDNMNRLNQFGQEQIDSWKQNYAPVEQQLLDDAKNWDSQERMSVEAATARSEVVANAQMQQDAAKRDMQRMGVSPSSGRFQENSSQMGMDSALAAAGAENMARNNVAMQGQQLRSNAAVFGRNNLNQAGNMLNLAQGAGGGAMGALQGAHQNFLQNQGVMTSGFSGAMQGKSGMADVLTGFYNMQMQKAAADQQAKARRAGGLGGLLGMGGTVIGGLYGGTGGAAIGNSIGKGLGGAL